jgi:hypothetical protein
MAEGPRFYSGQEQSIQSGWQNFPSFYSFGAKCLFPGFMVAEE